MSKKSLWRLIASVVVLILISGGIYLVRNLGGANPDFAAGSPGAEVIVDVPGGATGSEIAKALFEKGIVRSAGSFFAVAVADPRSTSIAPGAHRINQHIPAKEALTQLLDTSRIANLLRIVEGSWTDEIFAQLIAQGHTKVEIDEAVRRLTFPAGFGIDGIYPEGYTGLEGVFFPAQYSFGRGTSALTILQNMMDRFAVEAKASGISAGTADFKPKQLLTIASLVQAEGDPKDFGKISQVIRNRLKVGMQLQLDTTIHYITRTRGSVFLSTDATRTASPYNTYLYYGLPPGPIDNPGRAAMDAAVNPVPGNWTYFITVKPGDTRFTDSNSQFLIWKSEYEKNLASGAFGKKS